MPNATSDFELKFPFRIRFQVQMLSFRCRIQVQVLVLLQIWLQIWLQPSVQPPSAAMPAMPASVPGVQKFGKSTAESFQHDLLLNLYYNLQFFTFRRPEAFPEVRFPEKSCADFANMISYWSFTTIFSFSASDDRRHFRIARFPEKSGADFSNMISY